MLFPCFHVNANESIANSKAKLDHAKISDEIIRLLIVLSGENFTSKLIMVQHVFDVIQDVKIESSNVTGCGATT